MRKIPWRVWTSAASCIVVFMVITGLAETTKGGVIAYEGFLYNAGATLNGLNGGTGFSNAWFVVQDNYVVMNGSLADPTSALLSSGNSLHHTGVQPRARRNLNGMLGTTGTTIYCSFLLRQDAVGDFTTSDHDFGGLILGGVNQPDIFGLSGLYIGRGAYGSKSDKYVLGTAGDGAKETSSGVSVVVGSPVLLVARVDFLDGPDRATLYVNPSPGSSEPTGGAVFTGLDLGTFNQLAITHGNNSVWTTDEIRIATTWNEATVPEPSTLVLLGIGAISLLAYAWRRRQSA